MRTLLRVVAGLFVLLIITGAGFAFVLSQNGPCQPLEQAPPGPAAMKAVTYTCYGSPDVLQISSQPVPQPEAGEVLIRVRSAAVNPMDWHFMRGSPYFMRLMSGIGNPENERLGTDFSGVVEAVGSDVTRFRVGDEVFGGAVGAFAGFVTVPEGRALARKPDNVSHAEAAAMPVAAITALQALRDKGGLEPGQQVLINGASGGVGTYAVQIARAMGASVTGVCSTRNAERVLALGADRVIDYTVDDYTRDAERYDLIVDMVGNRSIVENRRIMKPDARMVIVAGGVGDWIGPFGNPIAAMVVAPFVPQRFTTLFATLNAEDLETLAGMMSRGQVRSTIDRHYPLEKIAEAISYSESGRARGKIIIDIP